MEQRRFVLLDRDGTIIVQKHYLSDPDGVELLEGAAEGLRRLAGLGLGLVVVTNQSPIGRGLFARETLERIHARMNRQLAAEGVTLDGIYHCPHTPDDGCDCRKPRTGMAERASREHGFDPARCFVVGDMASDVNLGRALGATTFLVRSGYGRETAERTDVFPDHVVDGLCDVAEIIERKL